VPLLSAEERASLPVQRAFVVQFRDDTDVAAERLVGRVEHVVSGRATHFSSLEELLTFIGRVLAEQHPEPLQGA
jgi:hypothetical protein